MPATPKLRKGLSPLLLVALLTGGCSGAGGTKAGGSAPPHATVLTFASQISGGQPEQLAAFARAVARESGGALRVRFVPNWRAGDERQEHDTIADVRAGKADLAWVGARAWDAEGIHSFDALIAPLLIDSHALEQRVFAAKIPQQMLPAVRRAGVVPIGILPGPLRTIVGVGRPLIEPDDFRGRTIGVQGVVAAETARALGARPRQYFAQPTLRGLDGIDEQRSAIVNNGHAKRANYLTGNANLWPRPLVLFAAPKAYRSLTPNQRTALRRAAADAVGSAMTASRNEDVAAARALCRLPLHVVSANGSQLAALQRAVEPVYRRLRRDAVTRPLLNRIQALRRTTPGEKLVECSSTARSSGSQAASPLDGVWEMTVSRADLTGNPAYGHAASDEDLALDVGHYRLALHDGRVRFELEGAVERSWDAGVFSIHGHTVVFRQTAGHDVGETWAYSWSIYRDTLTFRRAPASYQTGPPNPMFEPWHRVGR